MFASEAYPGSAGWVMARLDALAAFTDEPGRITRLAFSPSLDSANAELIGWMRAAGMTARIDAAGNVVGRYEGLQPDRPALLLGSHLDTVRNGGRYDGALGVVAALAVVERLAKAGERLPFAIEIVAFADEEGVRFGGTVLGSWALAGRIPEGWRERVDGDGVRAEDAVRAFGVDPDEVPAASRAADPPFAYVELHIEQGPILEQENCGLGIVTAIAGASRLLVTVAGQAGHAGTVPMALRRDALVAASECVLAVDRLSRDKGAVGTVGHLRVEPDAVNVIPGRVRFSVDIRSGDDAERKILLAEIRKAFDAIAVARGVGLAVEITSDTSAVPCAPVVVEAIGDVLADMGLPRLELASGAGHDGIAISSIAPIGMIFLRCVGGVSHDPAEAVGVDDVALGIEALERVCRRLGETSTCL
ncbi:allantoate amidohydrolase [Kaistia algarum]|uniref:allantoate amidohydrolase n=1 Tax=Kaistia algarum TaxID=2083279 RepID=UPI0014030C1D|nr:allantoate amidohydrolase [Kaistia algarum]MCX5514952.1 allantoate amidohydrolase [Kaistia algarum]